jgi:hypothetical protein
MMALQISHYLQAIETGKQLVQVKMSAGTVKITDATLQMIHHLKMFQQ